MWVKETQRNQIQVLSTLFKAFLQNMTIRFMPAFPFNKRDVKKYNFSDMKLKHSVIYGARE